MSIISDIFQELWNTELNYKGMPVNFFGIPRFLRLNKYTLSTSLSRMKSRGLIRRNRGGWRLSQAGRRTFHNNYLLLRRFDSPFRSDASKNLLLIFDIPEVKRKYRNWLRTQLKIYGYTMVQKSVWLGPSPLPKEFRDFACELKIKENIKTYRLAGKN